MVTDYYDRNIIPMPFDVFEERTHRTRNNINVGLRLYLTDRKLLIKIEPVDRNIDLSALGQHELEPMWTKYRFHVDMPRSLEIDTPEIGIIIEVPCTHLTNPQTAASIMISIKFTRLSILIISLFKKMKDYFD